MLPVNFEGKQGQATKLFVYPYVDARRSLEKIANSSVDEHFGYKLRYTDPATGSSPIPTIGAFLQLLPKGMRTRGYRSTDSTIYVCLEGHGSAFIEGERFPFVENDIFIVPSWKELEIEADEDGDYLDKDGNIYNDETGECIGRVNPNTKEKVFFSDL